jgi:CBS domain-containing protein
MPIVQIAEIVARERIHAIPIVDEEKKVIGIVTETDFFTKDSSNVLYIPQLFDFIKSAKDESADDTSGAVKAVVHGVARDIMTEKCATVRPETTIEEFISLIRENNFNSFPVVNEAGVLVGIATVFDLIKMI